MSEQYLWDRSGVPDPEVERIEQLLGQFKYVRRPHADVAPSRPSSARIALAPLAVAASIVLLLWSAWPRAGWNVETIAGAPRIGRQTIRDRARLAVGDWLMTDAASRAKVSVASIGSVELSPNTRVQLKNAGAPSGPSKKLEYRLAMRHGKIEAYIDAPPRLFIVDTPAATAIDLGCLYTLEVDESGDGLLLVTFGEVELAWAGRRSFVPADAQCAIRQSIGPGTPHFRGSEALIDALRRFDFDGAGDEALDIVLAECDLPRDTLTLWHLLSRVEPPSRARVLDKLAALIALPEGLDRSAVLQADEAALTQLKQALQTRW